MSAVAEILARLEREADELARSHAAQIAELDETAAARRALALLGESGLAASRSRQNGIAKIMTGRRRLRTVTAGHAMPLYCHGRA